MAARFSKLVERKLNEFLRVLKNVGTVTKAAERVQVSLDQVYLKRSMDRGFELKMRGAKQTYEETLKDLVFSEVVRRALDPDQHGSERLLVKLLERYFPEFRPRQQFDVTSDATVRHEFQAKELVNSLTEEQLNEIESLLEDVIGSSAEKLH